MGDVGRPSLYEEKYCKEIIEYFSVAPYVEKIVKKITKSGDVVEIPMDVPSDFPSFAGFACRIGVHRETLLNWCEVVPEFFDAYKRAKDFQENWLVVNGNKGLINPAFGIFTAKNVLKWTDRPPEDKQSSSTNVITLAYAAPQKRSA